MSEEELAEEIGFSEESLEEDVPGESRDYLASLSNEKIQFQHVKIKDPEEEKAKRMIEKQLNAIEPKFDDSY